MSDDGSEMDSKYNMHLSFIIVVRFKSQISTMLMFGLFFVLYFVKLLVGDGFCNPQLYTNNVKISAQQVLIDLNNLIFLD